MNNQTEIKSRSEATSFAFEWLKTYSWGEMADAEIKKSHELVSLLMHAMFSDKVSDKIEGTVVQAGATDTDGVCRIIVYVSAEELENFSKNLIYKDVEIRLLDEKEKQ